MVDAVNLFSELRDVWDRYTAVISMFLSCQYAITMVMLFSVFLKYGVSEFSRVLLSAVFVDLYRVADRKHILRIYDLRSKEMEPMMKNTSNIHHGVRLGVELERSITPVKLTGIEGICSKRCSTLASKKGVI